MMLLNGPLLLGVYGSAEPVTLKHRPQASPGPTPVGAPKESWLIAAVYQEAAFPHAIKVLNSAYAPLERSLVGAYQDNHSHSNM